MKDGLYIDVVSKTIITKLSESIAVFVSDNTSAELKKVLLKELPVVIEKEISAALEKSSQDAQEIASKTEKLILGQLENIMARVEESADSQAKTLDEALQGSLKKTTSELTDGLKGLHQELNSTKEAQGQAFVSLQELNTGLATLGKEVADGRNSAKELQSQALEALQELIEKSAADSLKKAEKSSGSLLTDLEAIRQQLDRNSEAQGTILAEVKQADKGVGKELTAGLTEMQKSLEVLRGDFKKISSSQTAGIDSIQEELTDLEGSIKEQKDLFKEAFKGDFKNIGRDMSAGLDALHREIAALKEKSGGVDKQTLDALQESIEENVAAPLKRAEKNSDKLQNEVKEIHAAIAEKAREQNDLLTSIIYATKKLSKGSPAPDQDLLKKIDDALDRLQTGILNRLDKDAERGRQLEAEIKKINAALAKDGEQQGQGDMLNSIFYSIKKLTSAYNRDQDIAQKFESQFMVALNDLYAHIRRLEEDKEELYAEIIRVAGSDFLKGKLTELEKELEKARAQAEAFKSEKMEMETRLEQMQGLLEDA